MVFLASALYSQPVTFSVSYDTAITKTEKIKSFYLKNPTNKVIHINSVRTVQPEFYMASFTPFNINPYDSVQVNLSFKTRHNITYRGFVIFENTGLKYSIIAYLTATGKYSDVVYAFTQNLWDEPLKTAIRTYTSTGYVQLGYDLARDNMFATVDKYLTNDTIECVYSGTKVRAVNRTEAQALGFNTEHTYPQSYFGGVDPMVSDLYHLYPTTNTPNSCRGNYAFGKVVTFFGSSSCYSGSSKRGIDSTGLDTVYEPRDVHKGNVARSLFYFTVKYNTVSPGGFMNAKQENRLRQWNNLDTVDNNEMLRNNRIAALEHVRNPFIDHPELIERILSTFSTIPARTGSICTCSPLSVVYDTLKANDTSSYYVAVMNTGYTALTVTSVTASIPQFTVDSYPTTVPVSEVRFVKVKFKPTALNTTYTANLSITGNDASFTVPLKGFSNNQYMLIRLEGVLVSDYKLYQNYPNPFNPQTIVKFDVKENSFVTIKLYDVTGKVVSNLFSESLNSGSYSIDFNAGALSSGVYFLRMEANTSKAQFSSVKSIVLSK